MERFERFHQTPAEEWIPKVSRPEIVRYLSWLKEGLADETPSTYAAQERRVWIAFARHRRPLRAMSLLLGLIGLADVEGVLEYADLDTYTDTSAHHENLNIVKLVTEICQSQAWPPYPALIVRQDTGEAGAGMLDAYGLPSKSSELALGVSKGFREVCYRSFPPDIVDIMSAFYEVLPDQGSDE